MEYTEAWFKIKTIGFKIGLYALAAIAAALLLFLLCATVYATIDVHRKHRYLRKHGFKRSRDAWRSTYKEDKYSWSNGKRSRTEEEIIRQSFSTLKAWVEA